MSIFGVALRGFGKALLKKGKNTAKKKFDSKLSAFKSASDKNAVEQTVKKIDKKYKKASERALEFSKKFKKD